MRIIIICLLSLVALTAPGAPEVVPRKRSIPAVPVDPKASAQKEQVHKPTPMTEQELRVVRNVAILATDKLVEMLRVYERENNDAMELIITRELLKRNPNQPDAVRVSDALSAKEESRPPEYLRLMVNELNAGSKVADPDAIAIQAHALAEGGKAEEAIRLLEKLRRANFPTGEFPYMDDLASAYQDAGLLEQAEAAYEAVVKDPLVTPEVREEAQRELQSVILEKRIAQYTVRAEANPSEGVSLSEKLLKEHPDDPQAVAFHLDSLDRVGRYKEVINTLLEMKAKSKAPPFPYQETLAYAYYGAKNYAQARGAFAELLADRTLDKATRKDAEETVTAMTIEEQVERGLNALDRSDTATAKTILAQLEKGWPDDDDVIGLRAMWMQKTGHSNEALKLLLLYKQRAANEHRVFSQQDTLADLYLERKEFNLADAAYAEILETPGYDEESRHGASDGLNNVRREKLIDRGDKAIKNAELSLAKDIGEALSKLAPDDKDVKIYLAELKLATGHPKDAYTELSALKTQHFANQAFPGQDSMGDALNHLGKWDDAYAAYSEIVETSGYDKDDAFDAAQERKALQPFIRNDVKFTSTFDDEEQGYAYRQELVETTPWWNNWRAVVSLREDAISLRDVPILIPQHSSRMEGQLALQHRFDGGYFAEASLGGADDNVLYGARIGKLADQGIGWSLGYYGNARVTDYSLPLELLNARENRVQFTTSGQFNERVRFDLDAFANAVNVDQQRLGTGFGANGNLELVLQPESRTKGEFTVAYVGDFSQFHPVAEVPQSILNQVQEPQLQVRRPLASGQQLRRALPSNYGSEIYNDLISREIDRHGIQFAFHKHLGNTYGYFGEIEGYYEFADKSWNYAAAAGFEYWLNNYCKLFAEIRYDSDARGPDANAHHGALEAIIGVEGNF